MGEALALGEGARGTTAPNPNVGCVIVAAGAKVGAGATQPGGRPHAEAMALAEAGAQAKGATLYVTLEPCAHDSARGPACADLIVEAGISRVVAAIGDPDPRTNGKGFARLQEAGIEVTAGIGRQQAVRSIEGFLSRIQRGRPFVTLKLAMSIDGRIALASGESRWITGAEAREDVHRERARADMILIGRGTYEADRPALDVRLPGLKDRSPRRAMLSRGPAVEGWTMLAAPEAVFDLGDVNELMIEGGGETAAAFLAADMVDRLIVYRAPILIGAGAAAVGDIGLVALADAHGRWRQSDSRALGSDRRDVYERVREE